MLKVKELKSQYKHGLTGFVFILPALIMLTIFVFIPLVLAVHRSFFDYQVYAVSQKFLGWENYIYIFKTKTFVKTLLNVLQFAAIVTVSIILLSFGFAHILKNINSKLSSVAKTIIYVPTLIAGITTAMMFMFMTRYSGGLLNGIRLIFDKEPISYSSDKLWSKIIILVPIIWQGFGYNALVMYAALINIPKEYYEAASIDGVNWYQRLFFITLPNMRNYFLLLIVSLVCGNLQMFDYPFLMTGGGPMQTTYTPVMYLFDIYKDVNLSQSKTYAGAILLMIIIVVVNGAVFFSLPSKKSEDA